MKTGIHSVTILTEQPGPSAQTKCKHTIILIHSPSLPFYDTKIQGTRYKIQGLRLGENVEVFHQTSVIHDHTQPRLCIPLLSTHTYHPLHHQPFYQSFHAPIALETYP